MCICASEWFVSAQLQINPFCLLFENGPVPFNYVPFTDKYDAKGPCCQ